MTYLIPGANGLVGQQFVKLCGEKNIDYVGTRFSRPAGKMGKLDFLKPERLAPVLDYIAPTVVVHCVNLAGGVNFCEENPEPARKLHFETTRVLADWCAINDAVLVFFSSDYVFDGKNPPYKEEDPTGPLNLYGRLKLDAEKYIRMRMKRHLIIRTTNVFGWDPVTPTPNFLMYLYQTLMEGKPFNTPTFLYGNPTYVADLANAVMELIAKECYGLFHIVGDGYINRYEWALKFCDIAGLDKSKIIKVEYPPQNIVPRPFLSNLDCTRVKEIITTKLHNVDEGLQLLATEMKKKETHF